ncbi:dienelactone hydrolase family protein [Paraburkholderia graminis]|uniref:dienelactone hydrolase family protein n=1 Tax=Paraburkholderia graminis TaxID=60548 RepID=UPI003C8F4371
MNFNTTVHIDDMNVGCYAAGPTSRETPVILVLHEIFGVNKNIRETVDRLASMGYRGFAPDLFWRQVRGAELDPDDPGAREQAMSLTDAYNADLPTALSDLRSIVDKLRGEHGKVGVMGYCLGGNLAFQCWLTCDVDAVVSYYGVGIRALTSRVADQTTPLLLHFGKDDPLNPPETVAAIASAVASSPNVDVRSYDGVGHAFARLNAKSYVESTAVQADAATFAFLKEILRE